MPIKMLNFKIMSKISSFIVSTARNICYINMTHKSTVMFIFTNENNLIAPADTQKLEVIET